MIDAIQLQTLCSTIGVSIPALGCECLLAYLDAMLVENQTINLTAVREREASVMFHALDSLAMGLVEFEVSPTRALDLGTGNGFPGVAIACLFPEAHVVLMDRTHKKLSAIQRALSAAGFAMEQFEAVHLNANEAPARGYGGIFDLITTRAVGPPAEMGRMAQPLLAKGGSLLTWLSEGTEAPAKLSRSLRKVAEYEYHLPAPADRTRRLVRYQS